MTATVDQWDGADRRTIETELARCVLGHTHREELRMDLTGHIARQAIAVRHLGTWLGAALLPSLQRATPALTRMAQPLKPPAP